MIELDPPLPDWGGTTYAVTYVDLERAGEVTFTVDALASARLFINDVLLLENDRRRQYRPAITTARLWMPAGRSKVVLALTSRFRGPQAAVFLTDLQGRPVAVAQAAESASGYRPVSPEARPGEEAALRTLAERYLAAQLAFERGDAELVRELIDLPPLSASVPGLLMEAISWAASPMVPFDVARNRALALMRQAVEREPAAWRPHYELARFEAEEERYQEALVQLDRGLELAPEQPALWLLRASLLTSQGLWAETLEAIERVAELAPDSCEPARARLALARGRERRAEAEAAAARLVSCDRSNDALARAHLAAGRWSEATSELERLVRRRGQEPMLMVALAQAFRGAGEVDREAEVLERLLELMPEDRTALGDLVDLEVARGQRARAVDRLGRSLAATPTDRVMERRIRELLTGSELLEPLRVDGRQVIADYEASGVTYEQPSVLLLDRTLFRVYPDGSIAELTHNITRVQSDEGIELDGEFHLPRGAMLLTIRTIKADGQVLEPEDIEGKQSLSLPGLEVGDYVEVEYLRGHEPPPEFPGGVWPWRFYFQGFRRAFHHSELVILAPAELELETSWRGEPIEPERRALGALQQLRWVARQMGTLSLEPGGPNREELVPSVQVAAGASWPRYRRALAEAFADRDRPSRELIRRAREVVEAAEARTEDEQVDALFRWVAENVEAGGDPLTQVSHALTARTGARTRLTAAMARAVGLEVELGFARSSYADQTTDPIPSLDMYNYPVFRVGDRWVFLGEDARWSPACALPADLRGQRALMAGGDELFQRLGDRSCQPDRVEVELELILAADGRATGALVERLSGGEAIRWRRALEQTPEGERQGMIEEEHLADVLPGAEIIELEVRHQEALDRPLELRYRLRGARLAEPSEAGLRLTMPYASELVAAFASLPARQTPLVLHSPLNERLRVLVTLAPGVRVEAPETVEVIHPRGEFRLTGEVADGRLSLERRLTVRRGRIEPEAYAAFAEFCRAVDRAEQHPVELRLP